MFILKEHPHSIKIHPAIIVPFDDRKTKLSSKAKRIYDFLWGNSTFGMSIKNVSSRFITFQKIAEKLKYKMHVIYRFVCELLRSNYLKQNKDGYFTLVKEGAV